MLKNARIMPARGLGTVSVFGGWIAGRQVVGCGAQQASSGCDLETLEHLCVVAQGRADLPELVEPVAGLVHRPAHPAGGYRAPDGEDSFWFRILSVFVVLVMHCYRV
ncbi:hypothetical protein [Cupriavidus necator]|uniref:hypothetical protein n=1 Tax=Cupriavidus necator TaxID=106590 RepID=UPI003F7383D8